MDTALTSACLHKRMDIVKLLLDSGADINLQSPYAIPPIAAAVSTGSEDLIRLLISRGASVIPGQRSVCTSLWKSPRKDWTNTLRILLDAGLDANTRDYGGDSMLHRATASGAKDAVELLLQHGADVNLRDRRSYTPLYLASISRRGEIWNLLKAAGGLE
ncbi:ankyrin repeat-containing domain protein [Plectosphaerella cucumerina]|uniref:Ankyrin repeat-containing domain protein n=1 Tax=Plectosphaerella cucumerina TaxID=40658 RepID=A0A8K0TKC5_9PEZI|nr:ankyrin repeat-containing domain protein [Plectosphaerella cucumerina]